MGLYDPKNLIYFLYFADKLFTKIIKKKLVVKVLINYLMLGITKRDKFGNKATRTRKVSWSQYEVDEIETKQGKTKTR